MKNLILILFFFLVGCKQASSTSDVQANNSPPEVRVDTVSISRIDTVYVTQPAQQTDDVLKLKAENDSLRTANNKLGKELLHNKLIIQNAKYYLNIANKNASQQKFLRGWMNRALNQ